MFIKLKPTKTGLFVLFLVFLFYIFSVMSQTGLLYIFMGIIVSVFIINILYSIKGIKALGIRNVDELITTEDTPIETKIEIFNKSAKSVSLISVKCNHGILFKVNELKALSSNHITPKILFEKRGVYNLNRMMIETINPFGLFCAGKYIKCSGIIKVYPKLYSCAAPPASGFEPMLGGHYKGYHTSLFGEDFAGVRPYVEGYPVKFIHWKASSKGQGLFVKEFNEEYSGKISFLFQSKDNFSLKDNNILDWAVRAMGSMAFAALDIGHSIELTDFNGKQRFKASPFTNNTEILEFLTLISQNKTDDKTNNVNSIIETLPKKSSLVFILTQPDESFFNKISNYYSSERKILLYVPYTGKNEFEFLFKLTHRCFYYDRSKIWKV